MDQTNNSDQKRKNVNDTLYDWAKNSEILKKAFGKNYNKDIEKDLEVFFRDDHERVKAKTATKLYKELWGSRDQFGQLPPFELLKEFEYNSIYTKNYRDHTTHPIYVCFLGLYIYEKNSTIKDSFSTFIDKNRLTTQEKEDTFISLWLLSSLYHDIGYLLENKKISNKKVLKKFISKINELLQYPLAKTPRFCDFGHVAEDTERLYYEKINRKNPNFTIDDIIVENLFDRLQKASTCSYLATKDTNGLKEYYKLKKRGVLDHGISSALLLMYIWNSFRESIAEMKTRDIKNFFPRCNAEISFLKKSKLNSFIKNIDVAAQAIALHNISSTKNAKNNAKNKLTLPNFSISLKDMPLAFLLRLCDELQDWDRPHFCAPQENDVELNSEELSIIASNDGIFLRFFEDEKLFLSPDTAEKSHYFHINQTLQKYLNNEELTSLLHYETYTIVSYRGYILRLFHDEIQQNNDEDAKNYKLRLIGDLLSKGHYETFPRPKTKIKEDEPNEKLKQISLSILEKDVV